MTPAELFATAEYKQNEYRLARAVWCKEHLADEMRNAVGYAVYHMFELELAAAEGAYHGHMFRNDELCINAAEERARKRRGL